MLKHQILIPAKGLQKREMRQKPNMIESGKQIESGNRNSGGLKPDWCPNACHPGKQWQPASRQQQQRVISLDDHDLTDLVKRTNAD
ncbi:hypothetical protein CEXT_249541 [Caerostris extrusa]|uniref:Uncharacterized protein n=1 Tax=Caerostris extrusa TaxID=172846 RepID=A0AAV4UHH5_CAEEX|nr:hypothetical protein CEXT_249541 [Caerostris extrusa]